MDDKTTRDLSASAPANIAPARDPARETVVLVPEEVESAAEKASRQGGHVEDTPGVNEILQAMLRLLEEMQHLRRDFDTKVKYDESKERQIALLHDELQHRDDLHFRILRPIFMDLIALYDDISKMLDDHQAGEDGAANQWLKNVQSVQGTIEEILRQNGAEAFHVAGTAVNSERQRVVKAIPTDDPALDKQVARRLRKGFLYETKVLRPEWVEVYRYQAQSQH
jgi:molecular chaperone GrpE